MFATLKSDGFDEPSASGGTPVLTMWMPSFTASEAAQRAEPGGAVRVQLDRNAAGVLQASTGTSVPTRSGVSRPPGILEAEPVTA